MATAATRNVGGRPRVRPASPLFQRIEGFAKRRGLSVHDLARQAGVGVATLYQLKDPKVSTAKAIADALGVTLDRLTRDESAAARRRNRAS